MSFPNSNFEGNFSTYVFKKSFWNYRDLKNECWTSQHILCKKILNFFICVEVRILCKKVKYVWSSHFPEAITTNMQIGYESFVFEYPVTCKKKFTIQINFIEINVNVCLLWAHHVMTSIILHTRRSNCQKISVAHLVFMFQLTFIFRILRSWKARYHITPFRPTSYVLMRLKWLEVSNRVRNWNKVKNFIFVE